MSTHTVRGDGPPVVQDAPPASSITIQGVPPSVTREQVREALRVLGIDPLEACDLSFDETAVYVEVYSNGRPASVPAWRWTHNGKTVATHRLTIPILEKDETP